MSSGRGDDFRASAPEDKPIAVTDAEEAVIEESSEPRLPVTYEILRREGAHELDRPVHSLWWSGIAAGICIGLSVLSQALLAMHLPDTSWSTLIEKLGYSVGFLVVIQARQQLFTENTLTAVTPVLASPNLRQFSRLLRLWGIVLLANVVGATAFATLVVFGGAFDAAVVQKMIAISEHALSFTPSDLLWRGVIAGFLIALLVWILARNEQGHILMIVLLTWLIALGDFAHIIAGSAEAAILILDGRIPLASVVSEFFFPTLGGNLIGGTGLFALLAYAQIVAEMRAERNIPRVMRG